MAVSSLPSFRASYLHPLLLAAVVGIVVVAAAIWILSAYDRRGMPAGPFVEFEIRLPSGILLPGNRDIEVTFWSGGLGRGCPGVEVRRKIDPPVIAGRCRVIADSMDSVLSVRFSRFAEGYWKMPVGRRTDPNSLFGPWQRIEFIRAPTGGKEVSSLPHGEYFIRHLVLP